MHFAELQGTPFYRIQHVWCPLCCTKRSLKRYIWWKNRENLQERLLFRWPLKRSTNRHGSTQVSCSGYTYKNSEAKQVFYSRNWSGCSMAMMKRNYEGGKPGKVAPS